MIGVFLDGVQVSMIGVAFGVASSAVTALHSVVIKKSLDLLEGNALHLGWYSNLLSAAMLSFVVLAVGEGPDVVHLLGGGADNVHAFITGSIITVRSLRRMTFAAYPNVHHRARLAFSCALPACCLSKSPRQLRT